MDFSIAPRIPSFENSFWIYLSDSIITVDVKHLEAPTEPRKTSHMHRNRLVILEVALKSHEHLGTSHAGSAYKSEFVCVLTNCKLQWIHFAIHLSTSCGRSFGYGKLFMYSVFMSLTIAGNTLFTRAGAR